MNLRTLLSVALLALTAACASSSSSGRSSSYNRDLITREELDERSHQNMYDVINTLRSPWFRTTSGGMAGARPVTPLVYVDGRQFGGVETLRTLSAQAVQSARYMSASVAQNRYGTSEARPVIDITTRGRAP